MCLLTVRELAAELDLKGEERSLLPYHVVGADEAWLTTTS